MIVNRQEKRTLEILELAKNRLGVYTGTQLPFFLQPGKLPLKLLTLDQNDLGDQGFDILLQGVLQAPALQYLDVSSNHLTDASLGSLGLSLRHSSTLKVLSLLGNDFTGKGMQSLQLEPAAGGASSLVVLKLGTIHAFELAQAFDFVTNGIMRLQSLRYLYMHIPNAGSSEENHDGRLPY